MDSCNDWEDKCLAAWETTAKGLPKLEIARANRARYKKLYPVANQLVSHLTKSNYTRHYIYNYRCSYT